MIVAEVMTTPAITVGPEDHVSDAARLLDVHSLTSLPVIADGKLVGVLSEADVIRGAIPPDLTRHVSTLPPDEGVIESRRVADLMTPHPVSVQSDTDLAVATRLLTETTVKSLPVIDPEGRVVGVVSRRDVLRTLARSDSQIAADVDDHLRDVGDWLVDVTDGSVTITGPETESQRSLAKSTAYRIPGVREVTQNFARPSGSAGSGFGSSSARPAR